MADPFSIAMGILTVFGATGTVGRFLRDVVKLKNAPDILLELNNELYDLQRLVQRIHDVLREESEIISRPPDEDLTRSLRQIRTLLSKWENLIAYDLTKPGSKSDEMKLDRSRWIRLKSNVQELRDQVRSQKQNLIFTLSLQTRCVEMIVQVPQLMY